MLRTRHRVATYRRTTTGRLVEEAVLQRPSPADVVALARAEFRRGAAGAMAYSAVLDPEDEEREVVVLARIGWTPPAPGATQPGATQEA